MHFPSVTDRETLWPSRPRLHAGNSQAVGRRCRASPLQQKERAGSDPASPPGAPFRWAGCDADPDHDHSGRGTLFLARFFHKMAAKFRSLATVIRARKPAQSAKPGAHWNPLEQRSAKHLSATRKSRNRHPSGRNERKTRLRILRF